MYEKIFLFNITMMILLLIILILIVIEFTFINQITKLFDIEEIESFNTINNGFILVSGGISLYFLIKYIMEINERIFRIITFLLNFLGIITIMTVFIRTGLIK